MRMLAKNNLTSSSSFCAFREIARANRGNRRNRWLPSLYAICELFQLHCEGKSGYSDSKIAPVNVQQPTTPHRRDDAHEKPNGFNTSD